MDYSDVLECFADVSHPQREIDTLTREWADRYKLPRPQLNKHSPVHLEHWTHTRLGEHLDRLAVYEPRMITPLKPRRLSGRIVVLDFGTVYGQIDGRRRANTWRHIKGLYEVLIVGVYG